MNLEKFRKKFGKDRVVLPVVHYKDEAQAILNLEIAKELGADGAWLIDHSGRIGAQSMIEKMRVFSVALDWNNIGINVLGKDPVGVFRLVQELAPQSMGVWADDAGVYDLSSDVASRIDQYRPLLAGGLYFGGVAFKYQREVCDLSGVTARAVTLMDIVTTSGTGTGEAAPLEKLQVMRAAAGDNPLAIASGITPENISEYLPYVNAFLVATGINRENDFYNIDPEKLKALIEVVDSYRD